MKRGIYIGIGSFLFILGISGIASLQTGIFTRHTSLVPENSSEQKLTELSSETIEGQTASQPGSAESETPAPSAPQAAQSGDSARGEAPAPDSPQRNKAPGGSEGQFAEAPASPQKKKPQDVRRKNAPPAPAPKRYARPETVPAKKPVTIRFSFDPARKRDITVARVHFGDRIVIKVRRVGQANRRLYLTFAMPGEAFVMTPVRDNDRLVLAAEDNFGPRLSRQLASPEGAVLKLAAGSPSGESPRRFPGSGRGYYEIEMKIYGGNRPNMLSRRVL